MLKLPISIIIYSKSSCSIFNPFMQRGWNVMRIMVIDDSVTMRRIEIVALKNAGYTDVVEAENGKSALTILKDQKMKLPDLILLDWNMPEMNGLELLKILKKDNELKKIHVIMVTTESEKENVVEAAKNGASGFLVKPLTPEKFRIQVIQKINLHKL